MGRLVGFCCEVSDSANDPEDKNLVQARHPTFKRPSYKACSVLNPNTLNPKFEVQCCRDLDLRTAV